MSLLSAMVMLAVMVTATRAAVPWNPRTSTTQRPQQALITQGRTPYIHLEARLQQLTPDQKAALRAGRETIALEHGTFSRRNYYEPRDNNIKSWSVTNEDISGRFEFDAETGRVTVLQNGLYLIYSQMQYSNFRGAHLVKVSITPRNRSKVLLKCVASRLSVAQDQVTGTCYTSGLAPLRAGQQIWIEVGYPRTALSMRGSDSFWGMARLAAL